MKDTEFEKIMSGVEEHYKEAQQYFPVDNIVGIFLQGSQNYNLQVANSDIDTKLLVAPSFNSLAYNEKPVSTTHVRENEEHIDFKDIRLYFQTFRKQNINFVEILFTRYFIVNPIYKEDWDCMVAHREAIAHYNPFLALKAMKGTILEKRHAMEHRYPAKAAIIEKMGYDPKQLHHLLRVADFAERYKNGEKYENCLIPTNLEYLREVKLGLYNVEEARELADKTIERFDKLMEDVTKDSVYNTRDEEVEVFLSDMQANMMRKAMKLELLKGE